MQTFPWVIFEDHFDSELAVSTISFCVLTKLRGLAKDIRFNRCWRALKARKSLAQRFSAG
jgi:hypothetical protein